MAPTSRRNVFALIAVLALVPASAPAADVDSPDRLTAAAFEGLELRGIGPAFTSGRISDVVKDPTDPATWYVAVASGGVWKTVNSGTTWIPVFDDQPSYSIGTLTLDPNNPHVVWVGTGENNSQRSAGWGDGVYRSRDGGESWEHMGLERSEHIGKILIDPRDSDVVFVAAQGPLWSAGGDRGLYRSEDGGETWGRVLEISEHTGVSDVVFDPRDPDVLYAASYQRRRRQWALIAGGPESAIFKSTDRGETWRKLTRGLPEKDVGRIGLAVSPVDPDVVYATIAATEAERGFYRSSNRGESWEKMSDYVAIDPQYYQEIFPDPRRFDRVYVMDVWIQVSDDGGATWETLGSDAKHVDNHAMLFDGRDPDYLLVGCDGGIYESWDRGETWRFVTNLPVTQFYRVGVDQAEPFYNVFGGTQDNGSLGGPSRTTDRDGIPDSAFFVTHGGDGYQTRVDPTDPNIMYAMSQYGGLIRRDHRSGETVDIQPQPGPGEPPLIWNWDSPLLLSPHSPTRLYFAANRLFRSDDRGDSWTAVSPDLTRQIDRNQLEVMGRVWSVDAVWKNVFTSFYGSIVAFDESPRVEGLLYSGTDDGLVQVSEDGGVTWRRAERFPGVPERTLVADLTASRHDPDLVYAVFNNHKSGDFTPYFLKSADRGRTWTPLPGEFPEGHAGWTIVEDPVKPELLFAGTEFGVFFSLDAGGSWIQLKGGVPTVAFRDLEIQGREDDLVAATFGRGFFILDDYSPLRQVSEAALAEEAQLFPVKRTWMFVPSWDRRDDTGHQVFRAPNPPFGAIFTYHLRDTLKTRRQVRQEAEDALRETRANVPQPSWDEVRAEDREEDPRVLLVVRDETGEVVRRVPGPVTAGVHRVAWDLRYPRFDPTRFDDAHSPWGRPAAGPMVVPGHYTVELTVRREGELATLGGGQAFDTVPLGLATLPAEDLTGLLAFQKKTGRLQRVVLAAREVSEETAERLRYVRKALDDTPGDTGALADRARELERRLADLRVLLTGDETVKRNFEPVSPSIVERVQRAVRAHWTTTSAATGTHRREYDIAAGAFKPVLADLRALVEADLPRLESEMDAAGSPWTPGRALPAWRPE
jgi:photosystem II stability/assembly factor-like uncharacterized protein